MSRNQVSAVTCCHGDEIRSYFTGVQLKPTVRLNGKKTLNSFLLKRVPQGPISFWFPGSKDERLIEGPFNQNGNNFETTELTHLIINTRLCWDCLSKVEPFFHKKKRIAPQNMILLKQGITHVINYYSNFQIQHSPFLFDVCRWVCIHKSTSLVRSGLEVHSFVLPRIAPANHSVHRELTLSPQRSHW